MRVIISINTIDVIILVSYIQKLSSLLSYHMITLIVHNGVSRDNCHILVCLRGITEHNKCCTCRLELFDWKLGWK